MATHQLAQGLASLGRHGDSMLMHVSPSEVAGLKAVGAMTGHKLSTNPHTGMPEAFDFGDFFTNLLPTLAGVALAPVSGGSSLIPIMGGIATGAAVAGAKGNDPLMGGLMGGLGGFGGGNLATSLGNMGAAAGTSASTAGGAPVANVLDKAGAATAIDAPMLSQQVGGANLSAATSGAAPMTYSEGLSQVGSGFGELLKPGGFDKFTTPVAKGGAGGSGMQLATSFGAPAIQASLPKAVDMTDEEARRKAAEDKYKDKITGGLNLLQASPDLRLAASGGLMSAYATGGTVNTNSSTISSGGIQDLYGTNDQTTGTQNLSKDGYGIGRLNTLAAEGSRAKAADTFYAMGGPIAFAKGGHQGYLDGQGDGMSDSIPATIEGKQPARLADGEFVIPADVVSHLGNGSSKAGSKQLYSMLDRIRKARTGNSKQGKEIKPQKYMPA
jgi:hypothetical protein